MFRVRVKNIGVPDVRFSPSLALKTKNKHPVMKLPNDNFCINGEMFGCTVTSMSKNNAEKKTLANL